jgi:hypothetical protein
MSELDNHSQQYLRKFTNAAERAMTAYDLLFKENLDLFKQNNESHTRESSNSNMVGKAKIMSFEDIQEAQKKPIRKRPLRQADGAQAEELGAGALAR